MPCWQPYLAENQILIFEKQKMQRLGIFAWKTTETVCWLMINDSLFQLKDSAAFLVRPARLWLWLA